MENLQICIPYFKNSFKAKGFSRKRSASFRLLKIYKHITPSQRNVSTWKAVSQWNNRTPNAHSMQTWASRESDSVATMFQAHMVSPYSTMGKMKRKWRPLLEQKQTKEQVPQRGTYLHNWKQKQIEEKLPCRYQFEHIVIGYISVIWYPHVFICTLIMLMKSNRHFQTTFLNPKFVIDMIHYEIDLMSYNSGSNHA